jgi:uncharacterized protein (DUF111 family)
MREIKELIETSDLSPRVKRDSLAIFEKIAVAEAFCTIRRPTMFIFTRSGVSIRSSILLESRGVSNGWG